MNEHKTGLFYFGLRMSGTTGADLSIEDLYQKFKKRLMNELASVDTVSTLYGEAERYPALIDNPASDHLD